MIGTRAYPCREWPASVPALVIVWRKVAINLSLAETCACSCAVCCSCTAYRSVLLRYELNRAKLGQHAEISPNRTVVQAC